MDPQLQGLAVQLADVTVRNTAAAIFDRIKLARTQKKNEETIVELEEIINDLMADKAELVRIAQAYEEELVAQRISSEDIEYISSNLVPPIRQMIESTGGNSPEGAASRQAMDVIEPLLSTETVTVLQLLGFNFRKAIGEPLTELVGRFISSRMQINPASPGKSGSQRPRSR